MPSSLGDQKGSDSIPSDRAKQSRTTDTPNIPLVPQPCHTASTEGFEATPCCRGLEGPSSKPLRAGKVP